MATPTITAAQVSSNTEEVKESDTPVTTVSFTFSLLGGAPDATLTLQDMFGYVIPNDKLSTLLSQLQAEDLSGFAADKSCVVGCNYGRLDLNADFANGQYVLSSYTSDGSNGAQPDDSANTTIGSTGDKSIIIGLITAVQAIYSSAVMT